MPYAPILTVEQTHGLRRSFRAPPDAASAIVGDPAAHLLERKDDAHGDSALGDPLSRVKRHAARFPFGNGGLIALRRFRDEFLFAAKAFDDARERAPP